MGYSAEYYLEALVVAAQSKRAVRFIRWGMEIPVTSFEDLIQANLVTFLTTGRYIEMLPLLGTSPTVEDPILLDF